MKIIHSADWHWEAEKIDRCRASAEFIIGKTTELKPDIHVIAGDYWNRRQTLTSSSALIPALETMKKLADISPVVIIKGNNEHDAEGSLEIFRDLDTRHPIHVTEGVESVGFVRTAQGGFFCEPDDLGAPRQDQRELLLHLFSYPTKAQFLADLKATSIDESNQLIAQAITANFRRMGELSAKMDCPVVFVAHLNAASAKLSTGQTLISQDIVFSQTDLELVGADYCAFGHIHNPQELFDLAHWRYSGSTYHCNYGEPEKKSFVVVQVDRHLGPSMIEPCTIPSRPLSLHEMTWDSDEQAWKEENFTQDWTDADLRLRIVATKEQHVHLTDDEAKRMYPGAATYQIERITLPQERTRSSSITKQSTLADKLKEWGTVTNQSIPEEAIELAYATERSVQ